MKKLNKKDYQLKNREIFYGLIESNGTLILENIALSILYPQGIKNERWDYNVAEHFYNITAYVQKNNLNLVDYDQMIFHLLGNLHHLEYNLKTYANFKGYIEKYDKPKLILSNENINTIFNFVINNFLSIVRKYYYFNTNKEKFRLAYLKWLNKVVSSMGLSVPKKITLKENVFIEPIKIKYAIFLKKLSATSFLFISDLSKCLLYPNYIDKEKWIDNMVDFFYETTLFGDEKTNALIPFERIIYPIIGHYSMLKSYFEAWGKLTAYIKEYGESHFIFNQKNERLITYFIENSLPNILKEYYYFNTDKNKFKSSLVNWLNKLIENLGYHHDSQSYLYTLEETSGRKLIKEENATDKISTLEESLKTASTSFLNFLSLSILYPNAVSDYKWDYQIAMSFYKTTTTLLKPNLKLLGADRMNFLLFNDFKVLEKHLDIEVVDKEYISKYGMSRYQNSKNNLEHITKTITKDLKKITTKHYYFNTDQEKFRIDYLKWFNKLIEKLGYNNKLESY